MDFLAFNDWLIETKGMQERSAKDVICRCKRVCGIVKKGKIGKDTIKSLEKSEVFANSTPCVKSQLKRAIILWNEFGESK